MAERETQPSVFARCFQRVKNSFLWMLESLYEPLVFVAVTSVVALVSMVAVPLMERHPLSVLVPSLVLMAIVYWKSPTCTLMMRLPSPISHTELNMCTLLSLFLSSMSLLGDDTEWPSFFCWKRCLVLAMSLRLIGVGTWLDRMHRRPTPGEFISSPLEAYLTILPFVYMFCALAIHFFLSSHHDNAVMILVLAFLLVEHVLWAQASPGLDSVMGVYGTLLLALSYILNDLHGYKNGLWVVHVIVNYCAQTFIVFSTVHSTAFIP